MFYKDYLPIVRRDDFCVLSECIVGEIKLEKISIFFTWNYRSPSQTPVEFESYYQSFTYNYQI